LLQKFRAKKIIIKI